jgi:uracil-DNA glycosylase
MSIDIENSWKKILLPYFETDEWKKLAEFVRKEYRTKTIYPHPKNIFNAFEKTPFDKLKLVIIGQDPYYTPGRAHGLSFSVPTGIPLPPSLKNIYREIENDLMIKKDYADGNLESWAKQGVFLLNSILTVEKGKAASHRGKGWESFTNFVIKKLSDEKKHLVFLLWGNYAKEKGKIIDRSKHIVLESAHPSPFSAYSGFFGNKHFSKANDYLKKHGVEEIRW